MAKKPPAGLGRADDTPAPHEGEQALGEDASSPDPRALSLAHAINNPLASLIANLDLAAEALENPAASPAMRVVDAREAIREAREGAMRIGALAKELQSRGLQQGSAAPADEDDDGAFSVEEAPTGRRSRCLRILVIDDEPQIGTALTRTLREYDVHVVHSGPEALALLARGDRFEVIFSDLMMPEMTGMDLYEEIVRVAPDQAKNIVFLTGGAVTTRARDFVASVPNVVIAKPFDVQKLRQLIRDREGTSKGPERVVLLLDDDVSARESAARWLRNAGFHCIERDSGSAAIEALLSDPGAVDAVVLDVKMEGIDAFDVIRRLKENEGTAHIPVVMLTPGATGGADIARGVEAGAVFHLAKPFSGPVLVAEVRAACTRAEAEKELLARLQFAEEHATTDGLTGLMNRRAFDGRLTEGLANTARHHEPLALVLIDLDYFKQANDMFGKEASDRVLVYFARALQRAVRIADHAFRRGEEGFALLLPKCDASGALRVVSRIQADLRAHPVSPVEGQEMIVRFCAGVATAEAGNGYRTEDLVARADAALFKAKRDGRDHVELAP